MDKDEGLNTQNFKEELYKIDRQAGEQARIKVAQRNKISQVPLGVEAYKSYTERNEIAPVAA